MNAIAAAQHATMSRKPADADFERAFTLHYEPVFRFAFRILGSRAEAEDVAQETFVRLLRRPPRLPGDLSLRAWLFAVSANLASNAARADRRREQRETRAWWADASVDGERDPAAGAVSAEAREKVRRALDALPARQAQILLLRHEGLTYREVAAAMCVAPTSVGTLLARAESAFEAAYRENEESSSSGDTAAERRERADEVHV